MVINLKKKFISVFVTKTARFKVRITEEGNPTYEVTVNSEQWKAGKGREYEEEIRERILKILTKLENELLDMREA